MATCPNKKDPGYIKLEEQYGESEAIHLFHLNNDEIPSLERASELSTLSKKGVDPRDPEAVKAYYDTLNRIPGTPKENMGKEKLEQIASVLSERTGIDYMVTTFEEAVANFPEYRKTVEEERHTKETAPYAFYKNGVVIFIGDKFAGDTPFHEFAHPFIDKVFKTNKALAFNLKRQLEQSTRGKALIEAVKREYPYHVGTDGNLNEDGYKEAIVHALGYMANDMLNEVEDKGLIQALKKLLAEITDYIKTLIEGDVKVETLKPDTTLSDLAKILTFGKGKINLTEPQQSTTEIKPGVQELFESNPELANQVYEALGFNNTGLQSFKNKLIDIIGVDKIKEVYAGTDVAFDSFIIDEVELGGDNDLIITLKTDKGKRTAINLRLDGDYQKLKISEGSKTIRGIYAPLSEEKTAINFLISEFKSLGKQEITPQQKQQALQAYSQYLDTVFTDSKVKDIVYHTSTEEIKEIREEDYHKFTGANSWYGSGLYFSVGFPYYEGPQYKSLLAVVNTVNPLINPKDIDISNVSKELIEDYVKKYPSGFGAWFSGYKKWINKNHSNWEYYKWENESDFLKRAPKDLLYPFLLKEMGYDSVYNAKDKANLVIPNPKTQVHILGSKQDIEGFKKFVNSGSGQLQFRRRPDKFTSEEIQEEIDSIAKTDRAKKKLSKLLDSQKNILQARLEKLKSAGSRKGYTPTEETLNRIKDLQESMAEAEERVQFIELVESVHKELEIMHTFLEGSLDGKQPSMFDYNNQKHIYGLLEIKSMLQAYEEFRDVAPDLIGLEAKELRETMSEVNEMFNNLKDGVAEKMENYLVNFIKENTKRNFSTEDILDYLTKSSDISSFELQLGGLSNSKDALLQLLHKHVEIARERIHDETDKKAREILGWRKKLQGLGIFDFDWMVDKTTGRIIHSVNKAYYDARKALFDKLKDKEGNRKEYIDKPLSELTESERAYNIQLQKDKKALREFLSPEYFDSELGVMVDGQNHKYSEEFKKDRATFEFRSTENGIVEYKKRSWNAVKQIQSIADTYKNEETWDKAYKNYKRKYYDQPKTVKVLKKSEVKKADGGVTWEYTGEVDTIVIQPVKSEFVEVNTSSQNGKWMDSRYAKLINDNTETGKVKLEFYKYYKEKFNEIVDELPSDVKSSMKNKVLRVRASLSSTISANGKGFFNIVKNSIRNFINPEVIIPTPQLDENGNPINEVGYYYVGDLKNQKKIDSLKKLIEEEQAAIMGLTGKEREDKELRIKRLKNSLKIEEDKLEPTEIQYDLIESLIKGVEMSENYKIMKEVESTLLIAGESISRRKVYQKTDRLGNPLSQETKNVESNIKRRFDTYMRMVFYNNSQANQTKVEQLLKNFGRVSSFTALGGNPFAAVNNSINAAINTRVESFGPRFGWDGTHLNKAKAVMYKYLAGGTYLGHFMDKWKNGPYSTEPSNYFEAMMKSFNWMQKLDDRHSKDSYDMLGELAYGGITAGEFMAQSNSAIAKLMATTITDDNGKTTTWWNLFEFKDGELKVKPEYSISKEKLDKERRKLSVEIKSMNKIIHGNYSETDRVAMQEHALGQLALQFKKWMFNYAKNRFGDRYFDETTGTWEEGRYIVAYNFMGYLAKNQMDFVKAWGTLSPEQKNAMRRNLAEFVYFMTAVVLYAIFDKLAEGVDDDDKELKMLVNFLKRQSDRTRGELVSMLSPKDLMNVLKNPVASTRVLQDYMDFIGEVLVTPYKMIAAPEDLKYVKGINKGDYKVVKELRDLVPVATHIKQVRQLQTSGNFFVGN